MANDAGMMPFLCLVCAVTLWLFVSVLIISGGVSVVPVVLEVGLYWLGVVLIVKGFYEEVFR